MIATISGTLKTREPGRIIVETAGIGYEIFVPLSTYYRLPQIGSAVALEIRHVVREDAIMLYGFSGALEKRAFDLLMQVQHVGPKLGLAILSTLEPDELAAAILREDVKRIDAVPGVGAKVAERVVRELRDRVGELRSAASVISGTNGAGRPASRDAGGGLLDDAVSALINLDVKPAEARNAVESVLAADPDAAGNLELTIRKSLAVLLGQK